MSFPALLEDEVFHSVPVREYVTWEERADGSSGTPIRFKTRLFKKRYHRLLRTLRRNQKRARGRHTWAHDRAQLLHLLERLSEGP